MADPVFVDGPPPKASGPVFVDAPAPKAAAPEPAVVGTASPTKYRSEFERAAKDTNVPVNVLRAVHQIEDASEDPKVVSTAGAVGEMQMEPATFKQYAKKGADITNPGDNIETAGRYIAHLTDLFKGDMHKVFAAYNAGEGNIEAGFKGAESYAKQAEANLKALNASVRPVFSAFGKGAPVRKTPVFSETAKVKTPQTGAPMLDTIDKIGDTFDQGAKDIYNVPGIVASKAFQTLPKGTQDMIVAMAKSPIGGKVGSTASFVGKVADLAPELVNAAMRDTVSGGNLGKFGSAIFEAIKNPNIAGDVLDKLAQHYGTNRKEELLFWARQPGVRDAIAKGVATTPEGQALQLFTAIHADTARGFITHEGLRDLFTGVAELYNPGNKIPGFLVHGATAAAKPLARKLARTISNNAKASAARETVEATLHATYGSMPMGDRFHMTRVKAGEEAAAVHHGWASEQARAPEDVNLLFNQENKLANTTIEQRRAVHREHDKFFNDHETAHLYQPQGGDPTHDPITQTTVMHKGVLNAKSIEHHFEHVFVQVPTDAKRVNIPRASAASTILSPEAAAQYNQYLKTGEYAKALALHPDISYEEGLKLEEHVKSREMGDKKTQRAYERNQVALRLISAHAKANGLSSVESDGDFIFHEPQKALVPDMTSVNGTSLHERAFYTQASMHALTQQLADALPSTAKRLLEGYWPRSGMFAAEHTIEERMQLERSLERGGGSGVGGMNPLAQKRTYRSIREAEEAGLAPDPNFDPAVPLERSMVATARLVSFVNQLRGISKDINYFEALQAAEDNGYIDRLRVKPEPMYTSGAVGKKELDKYIEAEAYNRLREKAGPSFDAIMAPGNEKNLEQTLARIKAPIYKAVEQAWTEANPDHVWDLPAQSGLEDLEGMTVPGWVRDAAIDSHPGTQGQRDMSLSTMMIHQDTPDHMLGQAVDGLVHVLRTAFLADPTYHPARNLAIMSLIKGNLNPVEILRSLFAPMTISEKAMEEARNAGALSAGFGAGIGSAADKTRARYAAPERKVSRQIYEVRDLKSRLSDTIQAYKNAVGDEKNPFARPKHVLTRAMFQADKWNQDLTFKTWEDAFATTQFEKYRRQGMTSAVAARKVRESMGDTLNITASERRLGLQRLEWFYSWMKTYMRAMASSITKPRAIGASNAFGDTEASANEGKNVDDPDGLADKGRYAFYGPNGQTYSIQITPPPLRKLGGLQSLVSAPFNQGEGLMDFESFVASSADANITPIMKQLMGAMAGSLGMQSSEQEQSLGGTMSGLAKSAAGAFVPPPVTAAVQGARDPVYYLNLLGFNVANEDKKQEANVLRALLKKEESRLHPLIYGAGSRTEREQLKADFAPSMQELQGQVDELSNK